MFCEAHESVIVSLTFSIECLYRSLYDIVCANGPGTDGYNDAGNPHLGDFIDVMDHCGMQKDR